MKIALSPIVVLSGLLLITSCGRRLRGEGEVKTQVRNVSAFSAVNISAPIKAVIKVEQGEPALTLKGQGNLLKHVTTGVENGILDIATDDNNIVFYTNDDVEVLVSTPQLNMLTVSGAGDAEVKGDVRCDKFTLKVSGAGDATLANLQASNVQVNISGAGDVAIMDGSATDVSYNVSGAGDINAFGLKADNVVARVSGAGDIKLTANRSLDAHVSGAGSIAYKGDAVVDVEESGAGSIHPAE